MVLKAPRLASDLAFLALARCVAQLLINPSSDFPLADDWAWARTVQAFLDTGSFPPPAWGPMSLLTHAVWGAIFCLPFGFSFAALRASCLVATVIAGAGCYLLVLEVGGTRLVAVVAALTWQFNPITFGLSATFMTD